MNMAPTQRKHDKRAVVKKNGTRILKPAIGLKRPKKMTKVSMVKKLNAVLTLVMPTPLPMRSQWTTLATGLPGSGYSSRKDSPGA